MNCLQFFMTQNLFFESTRKAPSEKKQSRSFVLLSVFSGRQSGYFFEHPREMTLGGKTEIFAYCKYRLIGVTEQFFGFFRFLAQDIIRKRHTRFPDKSRREVRSAHIQRVRYFVRPYSFRDMMTEPTTAAHTRSALFSMTTKLQVRKREKATPACSTPLRLQHSAI